MLGLGLAMVLLMAAPALAQADDVFVDTAGSDAPGCGTATGTAACASVDFAVDEASADDSIVVGPGTFTDPTQVVIDKDLSLVGAGKSDTTLTPGFDTGTGGDSRGWFLVESGNRFDVSDLTFDGSARKVWQAIRDLGHGTIDTVGFTEIRYQASGSPYAGTAIAAFGSTPGSSDVDVTNSTFDGIGRIGVQYFGVGIADSLYSGNTHVGKGTGDHLDYAVEVGAGATVDLVGNEVSGNRGVASSDGSTSAAFLITTFFGGISDAEIKSNTLLDNATGIAVGFDGGDVSVVSASHNRIVGNDRGLRSTAPLVDAENNWWGCNDGPGAAGCDTVDAETDADPWLVLEASADPDEINTGGETSDITASLTTNSDGADAGPGFPDGTEIAFATDLGSITSPEETSNGEAVATLTSGSTPGTAHVDATLDNATASTEVKFLLGPPSSKDECKKGGWKQFNNPSFKNQGDCVSHVSTGGKNSGNG